MKKAGLRLRYAAGTLACRILGHAALICTRGSSGRGCWELCPRCLGLRFVRDGEP